MKSYTVLSLLLIFLLVVSLSASDLQIPDNKEYPNKSKLVLDTLPLQTFEASLKQLEAQLTIKNDSTHQIDLEAKELALLEKEKALLMREQKIIFLEQDLAERMIKFEQEKLQFKSELEKEKNHQPATTTKDESIVHSSTPKEIYRIQFFASLYRDKSFPELSPYGTLVSQDKGNKVVYMLLVDDISKLESVKKYYKDAFVIED